MQANEVLVVASFKPQRKTITNIQTITTQNLILSDDKRLIVYLNQIECFHQCGPWVQQ